MERFFRSVTCPFSLMAMSCSEAGAGVVRRVTTSWTCAGRAAMWVFSISWRSGSGGFLGPMPRCWSLSCSSLDMPLQTGSRSSVASFWSLVFFKGFNFPRPGGVSSQEACFVASVLVGRPCPLPLPVPPWLALRTGHHVPHWRHLVSGLSLSCQIQFVHWLCRHVT